MAASTAMTRQNLGALQAARRPRGGGGSSSARSGARNGVENIALPIAGGAGAAALAVWGADKMDFHPDGVATAAALGGAAVAYMADNQTVKKVAIGAAALGTGLKVLGWMRSRQQPQQQPKPGQQPQQQAQQPRRQAEGDEYVTRRQLDEVVRAALAANNQEIVGVFRAELRNLNQPSALPSSGPTSSASSPAQRRDPWVPGDRRPRCAGAVRDSVDRGHALRPDPARRPSRTRPGLRRGRGLPQRRGRGQLHPQGEGAHHL